MQELVRICEAGGTILDPFSGSGSTLAAAILEGYNAIGVEKDDHYINVARQRVLAAMKTKLLGGTT